MYILTCPSCGSINLEELQRDEFDCADCEEYFSLSIASYEEESDSKGEIKMGARPGDIVEFKHFTLGDRVRVGMVKERFFIKDSIYPNRVDKTFCRVDDLVDNKKYEITSENILQVYKKEVI